VPLPSKAVVEASFDSWVQMPPLWIKTRAAPELELSPAMLSADVDMGQVANLPFRENERKSHYGVKVVTRAECQKLR
jgi:hypothetical protein